MRDIATQNIFTTVIKIFTAHAKAINMFYVAQNKSLFGSLTLKPIAAQ